MPVHARNARENNSIAGRHDRETSWSTQASLRLKPIQRREGQDGRGVELCHDQVAQHLLRLQHTCQNWKYSRSSPGLGWVPSLVLARMSTTFLYSIGTARFSTLMIRMRMIQANARSCKMMLFGQTYAMAVPSRLYQLRRLFLELSTGASGSVPEASRASRRTLSSSAWRGLQQPSQLWLSS